MNLSRLARESLIYYWRTNAAVVLGVATAVAVLSGALLVGDSVRGSLRDMVLERLGRTDLVVLAPGFVREELATGLAVDPEYDVHFAGIYPIVMLQGFVSVQTGGGRAGQVLVYGVGSRFWNFHGMDGVTPPTGREALLSPALARELGVEPGATILIRVERPSAIPIESLHGRKDDLGRTIRATAQGVLPRESLGEFSLQAKQGEIRALFLPRELLSQELDIDGRVNTLLLAAKPDSAASAATALEHLVRSAAQLEDLGMKVRILEGRNTFALESDGGLLAPAKAAAAIETAREVGLEPQPVFTYLVTTLRVGSREIPYSLVTAIDRGVNLLPLSGPSPIVLNDWAARDLRVSVGEHVTLEYEVWEDPGRLVEHTAEFQVARIVPVDTQDRDLAPPYPGITDSATLGDWDPPFPIDLRRIRPIDEEYWERHRTTPKAFIPYADGERLWQSRYGSMTSIRFALPAGQSLEETIALYSERLRAKLDPLALDIAVRDVRTESLAASQGNTDFGEYFVYFSFFLVVSALLLAALFFRVSVEQRTREVGLLRAVGFGSSAVRWLFLREGLLLAVVGACLGVLGGLGYADLMMTALGTWWVGAVGTTALSLHVTPVSLIGGALGGIAASLGCMWITLRSLSRVSERRLLADQLSDEASDTRAGSAKGRRKSQRGLFAAIGFAALGAALMAASAAGLMPQAGGFFGAGSALLTACLFLLAYWLGRPGRDTVGSKGSWPVARLGFRSAMYRPSRSVLSMSMIASATFILISVDSFRKEGGIVATDPHSGTGGYSLLVESLLPMAHDPNSPEGRDLLRLADFPSVKIEPFRVRPGDDASCLNLYEPRNPRILAPSDRFLSEGRFAFASSLAATEAERANPWLLLNRDEPDGAVPVIADANSMTYILHRSLGDEMVVTIGEQPVHLRFVAALSDSIFQGELLMSRRHFLRLFPEQEGYQFLLVEAAPEQTAAVSAAIEDSLADFGADVRSTAERLAEFHQVENTYLSTFQMLGGLGLLLGTFGLGAVLLRNVMERRRELALLRALGYKQAHFFTLVIAENALLLAGGLLTGVTCALLAIAPVLLEQGGRLPAGSLLLLLGSVLSAGLLTSLVATAAALRSPLLGSLRSE